MTVIDERAVIAGAPLDQSPASSFVPEIELTAWWPPSWQVRATVAGVTVFSGVVERSNPGCYVVHECLPERVNPCSFTILAAVARRIRAELGAVQVAVIHPAGWDDQLAAHGVRALHRMAQLGLLLDEDHLQAHSRPLPAGFQVAALGTASEAELAELSPESDRENDLAVWRDVLSGNYGPVIDDASVVIRVGSGVSAAVAVSEHRGRPLIGHCVVGNGQRGLGLGRAVLVHALLRLAAAGYGECRLHVVEDNWVAQRLYRSVGFTPLCPPLRVSLLPTESRHEV